jgi:serine/threonine protein kinase
LKPQNVGFDEKGTVKLFDLGNARELAFVREIGEELGVAGTPRYMANEVGAGREYGFPSDVCKFNWTILVAFSAIVPHLASPLTLLQLLARRLQTALVFSFGKSPPSAFLSSICTTWKNTR